MQQCSASPPALFDSVSLFLGFRFCIQSLRHADCLAAAHNARRPPRRVGRIAHATAALGRVLDPPIIATSVSLKVCPNAAQLTLDLAASVRTARRVAPEAEAVTEEAPTSGLEQFELLLLSWTQLTCIFTVQISAAQHWGEATARRVTRWDLHVEQVAAALDC